jgi:hypothetical protein
MSSMEFYEKSPSPFVAKCRCNAVKLKRTVRWATKSKVSNGRVIYIRNKLLQPKEQ